MSICLLCSNTGLFSGHHFRTPRVFMASRFLLARSRALTLNITRALNPFDTSSARCLLVSQPLGFSPSSPTDRRPAGSSFSSPFDTIKGIPWQQSLYGGRTNAFSSQAAANEGGGKGAVVFSPLLEKRGSALRKEVRKVSRFELSQRIMLGLMPALLLISKSGPVTSLLILSVYWHLYGFFKEILLDYVHHEVTRTWTILYLQLLLLFLAKDTILSFNFIA